MHDSRCFIDAPGMSMAPTPSRVPTNADGERGDVPGWVLVTLMTAGLVVAIWAIAGPALLDLFNTAIERVKNV